MELKITVDSRPVVKRLEAGADELPRATVALLNEAAELARGEAKDSILKRVRFPVDLLDAQLRINRASDSYPTAEVVVGGKRVSLRNFAAAQTPHGVTYQIAADGGSQVLPHAFGPNIDALHFGVFARKGPDRLPIQKKFGPSPAGVLGTHDDDLQALLGDAVQLIEGKSSATVEEAFSK